MLQDVTDPASAKRLTTPHACNCHGVTGQDRHAQVRAEKLRCRARNRPVFASVRQGDDDAPATGPHGSFSIRSQVLMSFQDGAEAGGAVCADRCASGILRARRQDHRLRVPGKRGGHRLELRAVTIDSDGFER